MALDLYIAFVTATVVLILVPGPNVAVIVANTLTYGVRYGLATVAGTTSAMVVQLACVVLGLSALMGLLADWIEWLRWAGVLYLAYLGLKAWRAPARDLTRTEAERKSMAGMYLRGLVVALTNPKTLFFYAAFLPQFVSAGTDRESQLVLLSVTFVALAAVLDSGWAVLAHRAHPLLAIGGRTLERLTGGLLLTAAAGLALARRP